MSSVTHSTAPKSKAMIRQRSRPSVRPVMLSAPANSSSQPLIFHTLSPILNKLLSTSSKLLVLRSGIDWNDPGFSQLVSRLHVQRLRSSELYQVFHRSCQLLRSLRFTSSICNHCVALYLRVLYDSHMKTIRIEAGPHQHHRTVHTPSFTNP